MAVANAARRLREFLCMGSQWHSFFPTNRRYVFFHVAYLVIFVLWCNFLSARVNTWVLACVDERIVAFHLAIHRHRHKHTNTQFTSNIHAHDTHKNACVRETETASIVKNHSTWIATTSGTWFGGRARRTETDRKMYAWNTVCSVRCGCLINFTFFPLVCAVCDSWVLNRSTHGWTVIYHTSDGLHTHFGWAHVSIGRQSAQRTHDIFNSHIGFFSLLFIFVLLLFIPPVQVELCFGSKWSLEQF